MSSHKRNYAPPSLAPVYLSDEEAQDLRSKYPSICKDEIHKLSEYMASTGKRYDSHYATLLKWCREDEPESTHNKEARISEAIRKDREKISQKVKLGKKWKAEGVDDEKLQNLKYEILAIEDHIKRLERS